VRKPCIYDVYLSSYSKGFAVDPPTDFFIMKYFLFISENGGHCLTLSHFTVGTWLQWRGEIHNLKTWVVITKLTHT